MWRLVPMLLILALAACGGTSETPTVGVGPTQTRAAEMSQLAALQTQVVTLSFTPTAAPSTPTAIATPTLVATPTATRVPISTPRPTVAPTATAPPPAALKVGDRAVSGRLAFTVVEIRDPLPPGQYSGPAVGSRWIGLDVIIETTTAPALDYNPFYSRLKTADNREYQPKSVTSNVQPLLQYGTQQSGESTRGWVTFEIPADAGLASLSYSVGGRDPRVIIDLR